MKSKVSIIRCENYEPDRIWDAVKRSINSIGGIGQFVAPGKKVLLKPNLLKAATPDQAVTTHPEFIRAVIRLVKEQTDRIFIGDSPGGMIKVDKVYRECGITKIAKEENVELVQFDRIVKKDHIPFAKIIDEVDVLISLPKFKTHNLTMITAAVKNVFGLVPGLYKVQCHKDAPNYLKFAEDIARIYSLVRPDLNIIDGIAAMQGDGPAAGDPYKLRIVAASSDAVSLDAVLSKIIGLDPLSVASTKQAHRRGLGQADINTIDIIGESLEDIIVKDFVLPKILALYKVPNFLTKSILRFIPLMMTIDQGRCNQCLACKHICPQEAIKGVKGRLKLDYRRCILCLCCSEMCPNNAIYLRFLKRRHKSGE